MPPADNRMGESSTPNWRLNDAQYSTLWFAGTYTGKPIECVRNRGVNMT